MRPYSLNTTSNQHKQLRLRALEQGTTISKLIVDACVQAGLFEREEANSSRERREIAASAPVSAIPLTHTGRVDFNTLRARGKL